jgi:hypothetical protein
MIHAISEDNLGQCDCDVSVSALRCGLLEEEAVARGHRDPCRVFHTFVILLREGLWPAPVPAAVLPTVLREGL